jgi:hypothetical protein
LRDGDERRVVGSKAIEEVTGEEGNVGTPLPEGRDVERDRAEMIPERTQKPILRHPSIQISGCRGDDSHVDRLRGVAVRSGEGPRIQQVEQRRLERLWQGIHVFEDECAALRGLNSSRAPCPILPRDAE